MERNGTIGLKNLLYIELLSGLHSSQQIFTEILFFPTAIYQITPQVNTKNYVGVCLKFT
jgi:hypothetical protein